MARLVTENTLDPTHVTNRMTEVAAELSFHWGQTEHSVLDGTPGLGNGRDDFVSARIAEMEATIREKMGYDAVLGRFSPQTVHRFRDLPPVDFANCVVEEIACA